MATIEVSGVAVDDLERLIVSNHLPGDTRERFVTSLQVLDSFPLAGPQLTGEWSQFRFWIGTWPWMIVVYEHIADRDAVVVVAIHDGRRSSAATARR